MYFIGIDLAWSAKNKTGIAILQGDETAVTLIDLQLVHTNEDIIRTIFNTIEDKSALISIDGPLLVPNQTGRRISEDLIQQLFGKYNAGAYPGNRQHLIKVNGEIRGEVLVEILVKNKFQHSPYIKQFEESKKVFEIYPHPAMVVLFDLVKVLPYKAKPKRTYDIRYEAFDKYLTFINGLNDLVDVKKFLTNVPKDLKGKKLKEFEDKLDAIMCAYIAYYVWKNPQKCAVLGDLKRGYMLTPIFDNQRTLLDKQYLLN